VDAISLTLPDLGPVTCSSPMAAIRALLPYLSNDQLNTILFGDLLRAESRRRWGCPGPQGPTGRNAVAHANGST
jgi:hypothetical protein